MYSITARCRMFLADGICIGVIITLAPSLSKSFAWGMQFVSHPGAPYFCRALFVLGPAHSDTHP